MFLIRAQYALVCEYFREGKNGTADFIGAFDRVFAVSVPAQHQHLAFVVQLVADSEDDFGKKMSRVTFVDPDNRLLIELRGAFELKPTGGSWLSSVRVAFNINGLLLPRYGRYHFYFEVDGKRVAQHPLTVATQPA